MFSNTFPNVPPRGLALASIFPGPHLDEETRTPPSLKWPLYKKPRLMTYINPVGPRETWDYERTPLKTFYITCNTGEPSRNLSHPSLTQQHQEGSMFSVLTTLKPGTLRKGPRTLSMCTHARTLAPTSDDKRNLYGVCIDTVCFGLLWNMWCKASR